MATPLFLKLEQQLQEQKPFAVYCKPGSGIVTGVFQHDDKEYLPDFTKKGFVFAPFATGTTVFIPIEESEIMTEAVPDVAYSGTDTDNSFTDINAKAEFEHLVALSIAAIKKGGFQKLVVSRKQILDVDNFKIENVFTKLLGLYFTAFRYCFYSKASGLWLGATPEQLIKIKEGVAHTVALAGTQVYVEGAEAVWGDKEQQEQQFVTDYIGNELKEYTTNISASKPYTHRASTIVHIRTDITATLKKYVGLEQMLGNLHPTPAVCGLPKQAAQQFILDNEGYDREYYSGFLGEVNFDDATGALAADLYVNLRCMKIIDSKAHLYIGCGITKDSNPEKEFIETQNKSVTMQRVL